MMFTAFDRIAICALWSVLQGNLGELPTLLLLKTGRTSHPSAFACSYGNGYFVFLITWNESWLAHHSLVVALYGFFSVLVLTNLSRSNYYDFTVNIAVSLRHCIVVLVVSQCTVPEHMSIFYTVHLEDPSNAEVMERISEALSGKLLLGVYHSLAYYLLPLYSQSN